MTSARASGGKSRRRLLGGPASNSPGEWTLPVNAPVAGEHARRRKADFAAIGAARLSPGAPWRGRQGGVGRRWLFFRAGKRPARGRMGKAGLRPAGKARAAAKGYFDNGKHFMSAIKTGLPVLDAWSRDASQPTLDSPAAEKPADKIFALAFGECGANAWEKSRRRGGKRMLFMVSAALRELQKTLQ